MRDTHRFLIRNALKHMAFLAREVELLDDEIVRLIREAGLGTQWNLLQTIPGIRETSAATILAESGGDMKQFPAPCNFSSWSGVAPGNNESAGVRRRAPTLRGNPHIKAALVESGWSASRTKDSDFQHDYERLKPRIGHRRAIVAAAHFLALAVYEVLATGQPYQPRRPGFKPRELRRLRRHHSRRLRNLDKWLEEPNPA